MEKTLKTEKIRFMVDHLQDALTSNLRKKVSKFNNYKRTLRDYIKSRSDEDLLKPIEIWLMVEDVSPTSGFERIGSTIAKLLEEHPSLRGLIYISNPNPEEMFSDVEQFAIISNDDKAICELCEL